MSMTEWEAHGFNRAFGMMGFEKLLSPELTQQYPQSGIKLVVNKDKPNTKKLLRQEQKRTLKNWGQNGK